MSDKTGLGDRMKGYEAVTRTLLPRRTYAVVRVDGRAFHRYLRHAARPFDDAVMRAMDAVAEALCAEMSGSVFAFTQSDECSVLLTDFDSAGTQPWFGGVVQKVVSVAASTATETTFWTTAPNHGCVPRVEVRQQDAALVRLGEGEDAPGHFRAQGLRHGVHGAHHRVVEGPGRVPEVGGGTPGRRRAPRRTCGAAAACA
ncbi:hypothetical protein GCM10020220_005930 [Nonomuraea rubra]